MKWKLKAGVGIKTKNALSTWVLVHKRCPLDENSPNAFQGLKICALVKPCATLWTNPKYAVNDAGWAT